MSVLGYYQSLPKMQCNQTCSEKNLMCLPKFDSKNNTDMFGNVGLNCSASSSAKSLWTHSYDPSYNLSSKECIGYRIGSNAKLNCNGVSQSENIIRICYCQNESKLIVISSLFCRHCYIAIVTAIHVKCDTIWLLMFFM